MFVAIFVVFAFALGIEGSPAPALAPPHATIDKGLARYPPPPHPINITTIAAKSGRVTGPTLEEQEFGPSNRQEVIQTSRKRADAPSQRAYWAAETTSWGMSHIIDPNPRGADTITLTLSGDDHWGSSVTMQVLAKHQCRDHPLQNWQFLNGQFGDCTAEGALADVYGGRNLNVKKILKDEAEYLLAMAEQTIDNIAPHGFYDSPEISGVRGTWFFLAATFESVPGYSYTLSRLGQRPDEAVIPDGKALGAATLIVAGLMADLVIHELENNRNSMELSDIYMVKIMLDCVNDLLEHGVHAITLSNDTEWKVTPDDVVLALAEVGRGQIGGIGSATRFLPTSLFHERAQEDLNCAAADGAVVKR